MSDTPEPIKLPSQPATEEQKAWHAYRFTVRQEEPHRLEEAAKFLAGMVSITFTILLSANGDLLKDQAAGWQAVASVLWLVALLLAFAVLLPQPYRTVAESAEAIEQAHGRIVRKKGMLLGGAAIAFLGGFLILGVIYVGVVL